jgi:twitching motility protein PilT
MDGTIPTVRFADILHLAKQQEASDIHLVPGRTPALRVNGELRYLAGSQLSARETVEIARALFEPRSFAGLESGADVSAACVVNESLTVRAHGFASSSGCVLAIRLLQDRVPTLESLQLPAVIRTLADRDRGLIIIGGPTGSGKSTTLAAIVSEINTSSARRIVTVEDPIEYRYESGRSLITQREIGVDAVSFARAMLGALRADPDVIVLGEMRDSESIRAALTAAETGHLVLTTVHTGSSVQTIDRIVDAFSGAEQDQVRALLAQSLTAVVSQRLLPRKHGRGRRAAAEILLVTDAVRAMIRDSRTHMIYNAMATSRHLGMQTLEYHLGELIAGSEIERDSARRVCDRIGERFLAAEAGA